MKIADSLAKTNRIYILPTRFGTTFLIGSLIMILVGATYQNNLVSLLSFFMLSLIFVAMVQTHNNLKDIRVRSLEVEDGFAEGQFIATVVLGNDSREPRYNLSATLRRRKPLSVYENVLPLPPAGTLALRSSYRAPNRGRHRIRDVELSSTFPLGLFRAWMWCAFETEHDIYPNPKGLSVMSLTEVPSDSNQMHQSKDRGDDFRGHRRFETGDTQTHIDWKAHARGRPLMVKEFNEGAPSAFVFDWNRLAGMSVEDRLSQLAAWIEEARRRRLSFALRIPGFATTVSDRATHATACLKALACFRGSDDSN